MRNIFPLASFIHSRCTIQCRSISVDFSDNCNLPPFWKARAWLSRVVTTNDIQPHIPRSISPLRSYTTHTMKIRLQITRSRGTNKSLWLDNSNLKSKNVNYSERLKDFLPSHLKALSLGFPQLLFEVMYLRLHASGIVPYPDVLVSAPSRGKEMRRRVPS